VHVAFLINQPTNVQEKEWAAKAQPRLAGWSTQPIWCDALGDQLTDAMWPVYSTPSVLVKFSHAGGLLALIGDWVIRVSHVLRAKPLPYVPPSIHNTSPPPTRSLRQPPSAPDLQALRAPAL
jgi:hypothetical protein